MAKRKFKLHKIRVHHNRWLIWAVAYSIMVAIALVGYIKVSNVKLESLVADNNFSAWRPYTNKTLGFTLRYPTNWAVEVDKNSVVFSPTNNTDDGVTIVVASTSSEKSLRKTLKIKSETKITVDGSAAAKIMNDIGGGHVEEVVLVTHAGKLYIIRGTTNLVESALQTFNFIATK